MTKSISTMRRLAFNGADKVEVEVEVEVELKVKVEVELMQIDEIL